MARTLTYSHKKDWILAQREYEGIHAQFYNLQFGGMLNDSTNYIVEFMRLRSS